MLTLLTVFGVFAAGIAAEAIFSDRDEDTDSDAGHEPQVEPASEPDSGGLLDEIDIIGAGSNGPALAIRDDEDWQQDNTTIEPEAEPAANHYDNAYPVSDDVEDPLPEEVRLSGSYKADILSGSNANDVIDGWGGNDLIDGRDGDDLIRSGRGDDAVWGGGGADTILGGEGADSLNGQDGDDLLKGGAGADLLTGHSGEDVLNGGGGADTLLGGLGNDVVAGGEGDDWLSGGEGGDRLSGGDGSDIIDGNAGNDWLSGLVGNADDFDEDFLNGGVGNDRLVLGSSDNAYGDDGEDKFVLHDWLAEGEVAHVSDYDSSQDKLIVVYDPAVHPDPSLTVEVNDDGTESTLLLDGTPLATVRGDPVDIADIAVRAA